MDQLIYRPRFSQAPDQGAPAEATSTAPPKTSVEKPSPNILTRAYKYVASAVSSAGEREHQNQSLFKEGDRVVIHSFEDYRAITATVRWTGPVRVSKSVMFAGLETVS